MKSVWKVIELIFSKLFGFFEEGTSSSSQRLAFLAWMLVPLAVWAYVCINSNPPSIVAIDLSVLGAMATVGGYKVVQFKMEKGKVVKVEETVEPETPKA